VKPQFEAGRAAANRGAGVISDPDVHRAVLRELLAWFDAPDGKASGLRPRGLVASPIRGRDGNREYLLHLVRESPMDPSRAAAWDATRIEQVVASAFDPHLAVEQSPGSP
jgi:23S rRNA (cytidine1920-2'-O)/16S rRNA (cytidine1409-2'-O)-methyltransferase